MDIKWAEWVMSLKMTVWYGSSSHLEELEKIYL